jgi:hypothetical protein
MALPYAQAAEDEKRACKSAGLRELGSLYKYRKGAANQIDGGFSSLPSVCKTNHYTANTMEHKRNPYAGRRVSILRELGCRC